MTAKYTLWTIPQSEWTPLPVCEITPEIEQEIREMLRGFDRTELDKRLEKFDTKISPETMYKIIP